MAKSPANAETDDEEDIVDDAAAESAKHTKFSITSYGADYPVETLVNRVARKDFYLPEFQRAYVWSLPQASRFIESLLLGLPIPSIFLFREADTNKHLIVDGQQRLRTLQYFKSGVFKDKAFRLVDVADQWFNKTYADLSEDDRRQFDDALIHSIIFRQDAPESDDSSIYEVFERLNSGGVKLSAQEIRVCVSHGEFVDLLVNLNLRQDWRSTYGAPSPRLKDQELILRFLSLKFRGESYKKPMKTFLDDFLHSNRKLSGDSEKKFITAFERTIAVAKDAFGKKAFRPERNLNTAVFDAVMVGLSDALDAKQKRDVPKIAKAYDALLSDTEFISAYSFATSDEEQVKTRIRLAREAFADC